jgi:hypothetical protein
MLMATKNENLQSVWHRYEVDHGQGAKTPRQAVEWAVAARLLQLPKTDPYDVLAAQMANALREEYQTDHRGRRYRVNHAVRVTKGGVQYTFWESMQYAPHEHMEKAFGQRREQIIDDMCQLKTDVDVYNDMQKGKHAPIQLVLDLTEDVAERQVGAAA